MRLDRWQAGVSLGALSFLFVLATNTGCAMLNGFLDPTKVGQFPMEYQERGIRRVLTPRDTPPGPPNAIEPTPEDLVAEYTEYRIGPGDQLQIVIDDLIRQGFQEQTVQAVTETGYVRVAKLGSIHVADQTPAQIEDAIRSRAAESGILPNAVVRVTAVQRNANLFMMLGSVNRPGPYQISRPNLRLLEAIGLAGDVGADAREMYIIRRVSADGGEATAAPAVDPLLAPADGQGDGLIIPPPTEQDENWSTSFSGDYRLTSAATLADEPTDEELLEAAMGGTTTQPEADAPDDPLDGGFDPIIFDPQTNEPLEQTPPADEPQTPPADNDEELPAPADQDKPFEWDDVPAYESSQRVIRIDLPALKAGDPRYNVVIRDQDVINVPIDTGVFYMMGEINRPGVFAFGGREITVKQAIALAGGFSPLAWPQRCEIIRREPGTDRQITVPVDLDAIFAGLEDDVLLRNEDVLNVGTHLVSPFLFVIRNSFRFTYGFGFVYDRNFADVDSYSSKINPDTLRRQREQSRGLLF